MDIPAAGAPAEPTNETLSIFQVLNARLDDGNFQADWKARRAMIAAARDYYSGDHPRSLKVRRNDTDPNVTINLCRRLINNSVAWLVGADESAQMLKMELLEGEDKRQTAAADALAEGDQADGEAGAPAVDIESDAEAYLKQVWKAAGGVRVLQRMARRASVAGHGFVKVLPVGDSGNTTQLPRLVVQQADSVAVLTQPDDADTAEAYVIQWTEKRQIGSAGRLRDVTVRQIIANLGAGLWAVGTFADLGRGRQKWVAEQGPEQWPYEWSPVVDWQNLPDDESYYGASDLEDLPGINDAINFTVSNVNRILYIHGHPRTIGTGFEAEDVKDTAIDSFWSIANKDADVKNLEMQSDLGSAFAFLQYLSQQFANIGRDLDVASLQDKIGQITNFGLRVIANSAIVKNGEKRTTLGEAINQINRRLLELGGFDVQDTKLHWTKPLPENILEEVARLEKEIEMAITSRRTASEERGRDWQTEQERIAEEKAQQTSIGEMALNAFSAGQGANALTFGRGNFANSQVIPPGFQPAAQSGPAGA